MKTFNKDLIIILTTYLCVLAALLSYKYGKMSAFAAFVVLTGVMMVVSAVIFLRQVQRNEAIAKGRNPDLPDIDTIGERHKGELVALISRKTPANVKVEFDYGPCGTDTVHMIVESSGDGLLIQETDESYDKEVCGLSYDETTATYEMLAAIAKALYKA